MTTAAAISVAKLDASGIIATPTAITAKLGTAAVFRPNRSISKPAGTNIETSTRAPTVMINPTSAALKPTTSTP